MSLWDYYQTTKQTTNRLTAEGDDYVRFILSRVPPSELWAQLAEEATELAHAALKLRRSVGGANPTPVTPDDAFRAVIEELADVTLLAHILRLYEHPDDIAKIGDYKLFRWVSRIREYDVETEA